MIAQRAARGLGSLYAHANEMTMEEAGGVHVKWTPRRWMNREPHLLKFEQHLYLRQPGYGTSYITGKYMAERIVAEYAEKIEKENRQNNGVKLRTEIVEILANRANDENYQIKAEAILNELTKLLKLSDDYGSTGELRALQNLIRQGGATGMTDDKERNRVASLVSRGLTSSVRVQPKNRQTGTRRHQSDI